MKIFFVWLGVNDVYNISNYISLLNEEIPKWKAQGADVYIVAVGQVTKDPYVTNEEIEDFNARNEKRSCRCEICRSLFLSEKAGI